MKLSFRVLLERLVPHSSFSRIDQTDLEDLSARVFFENADLWDFLSPTNDSRNSIFLESVGVISWIQTRG